MIKVPVNDGGSHVSKMADVCPITTCIKAMLTGGKHQAAGIASVARHSAVGAQLFEREPLPMISQYHGKAGGAALHRLHLHHYRHFLYCSFLHLIDSWLLSAFGLLVVCLGLSCHAAAAS